MRQIGTLSKDTDPGVLADHLLTLGISTHTVEKPEGWDVWVINEDHLKQARDELDAYRQAPDDPRYHPARQVARDLRRESDRLDRRYRKNVRDASGRWDGPSPRHQPLTAALMAISIVVYVMNHWGSAYRSLDNLLGFCTFQLGPDREWHANGLNDILQGQVWRLITPIFLHYGIFHILFNMWALKVLGTMIESRRGTRTLAVLVLLSAIASNVGEYVLELNLYGQPHRFGGMSGVVYALFGYVWMKGRDEPEQGMILHPSSIRTMLFWLFLCMTGVLGPIANGAHVIGLVVGVLFGLARF